jgi:two-component system, sensor histidine kinase
VQLLREAGFSVEAYIDGTAARALLEPNPEGYAAVILDHRLPGCQGLELLRQLRARGHHRLPVVILTGDDRAPLQTAIRPLHARLIVKPVLPEDLIAVLVALIDPSRGRGDAAGAVWLRTERDDCHRTGARLSHRPGGGHRDHRR